MPRYFLEISCQEILNIMLNRDEYCNINYLMNATNLARRTIYHNLKRINQWLRLYGIEEIKIERNKGVLLSEMQRRKIKEALRLKGETIAYVFTPAERFKIIIVTIILADKKLTLNDFENICQVSRNTVINDLKAVEKILNKLDLSLEFSNKKGYLIKGDVIKKRTLFFLNFYYLIEYYQKEIIKLNNVAIIDNVYLKLQNIELKLNADYVRGVIFSIAVYFAHLLDSREEFSFSDNEKEEIMKTEVFEVVKDTFKEYKLNDQIYLSLHLLGSRLQSSNTLALDNNDETYHIARDLIKEFMKFSCFEFDNICEMERALYYHLSTSIYRYRYGIQLANPLLNDIKREYSYVFEITKKACEYLQKRLKVPIPESEIGYITLHFGGAIRSQQKDMRILIVCPNGLSISNMIKGEVMSLVPFVHDITCISLNDYESNHDFDLVISTVDINDENHNVVMVQPILTDENRYQILKKCMKSVGKGNFDLNGILNIAKKYMSDINFDGFKNELIRYFSRGEQKLENRENSILHFLDNDVINVCKAKVDYKAAINMACNYLLSSGLIEYRYIEAIINISEKMNHYMFLTPDVYLAHAKSEDGANKLGFALVLFKEPVVFNDSKKAKIIIALSTPDKVSHLQIIGEIMKVFSNENNVSQILACNNKNDIIKIIKNCLE